MRPAKGAAHDIEQVISERVACIFMRRSYAASSRCVKLLWTTQLEILVLVARYTIDYEPPPPTQQVGRGMW